jgi:hypothetical protein
VDSPPLLLQVLSWLAGKGIPLTDPEPGVTWPRARQQQLITPRRERATAAGPSSAFDYRVAGADESLEEISWDEFFRKFESEILGLVYQEQTASGEEVRFLKLVRG